MAVASPPGFTNIENAENLLQSVQIGASATNLGGFTINQEFDPEVEDNLRDNTVLWQLITTKKKAIAPVIKKIRRTSRPTADFVDRNNLQAAYNNSHGDTALNLQDPGQEVKAVAGKLSFAHFNRSMYEQQGRPYGDEIASETDELLTNTARFLEMQLVQGDANSNSLAFNGIEKLIPSSGHIFTVDLTDAQPESIISKIDEVVLRASTQRNYMQKLTHIVGTGSAHKAIREEVGQALFYTNSKEVVPGLNVPSVMTNNGELPIITSPYLNDLDGGAGDDTIRLYLLDMTSLEWHGVVPFGGTPDNLEPQIFDITQYVNGQPLVEQRMVLLYGALYAKNQGAGIYRIDIKVPSGTVWNSVEEALV
jgi:hypothetical protein